MIRIALTLILLTLSDLAGAAPTSVAIGDLVLDYDDAAWRVSPWPDGLMLRAVDCTGLRCEGTGIAISIGPADGPLPTGIPRSETGFAEPLWDLLDRPPPWADDGAVRDVNGLTIFATDRWSGCRAMSPSELTAILDHAGKRYTFASGIAAGCRGVWGVGREAFVDILAGLRPRD
jgi:hypothetical protein